MLSEAYVFLNIFLELHNLLLVLSQFSLKCLVHRYDFLMNFLQILVFALFFPHLLVIKSVLSLQLLKLSQLVSEFTVDLLLMKQKLVLFLES